MRKGEDLWLHEMAPRGSIQIRISPQPLHVSKKKEKKSVQTKIFEILTKHKFPQELQHESVFFAKREEEKY